MATRDSTHSSAYSTTTIPDGWEEIPCVQYGFPEGEGPFRSPKLRPIFEPIPEGAITASPVYLLTQDQYERQERFESGYEVSGVTSIATELQDACEAKGRVLYPVHVEADSYLQVGPETLITWFREFVEDILKVNFHDCSLYFSGNRSIHVHVPRFVHGDNQRTRLMDRAKTFCEETDADLDLTLYDAKSLFRLPGVNHRKSTLPKAEIEPEWDHDRIIREANSEVSPPGSYAQVLRDVFALKGHVTVEMAQPPRDDPHALFRWIDTDEMVLDLSYGEHEIETPLIEQRAYPDDPSDVAEWMMYNSKEFSPYALASGNPRSIAALEVKGGAFAREGLRGGAPMVPARFFGAVGCDGSFTKETEHAPLQLSEGNGKDYAKWVDRSIGIGDYVVIIGGQSRSSIILGVTRREALHVGYHLIREHGGRQAALEYLSDRGYDVGASGTQSPTALSGGREPGEVDRVPPMRDPTTDAQRFQQQAEQRGISTLTHMERWRVACRLLWFGWEPAWDWFRKQYGNEFKPAVTWDQLSSAAALLYPEMAIPERPD